MIFSTTSAEVLEHALNKSLYQNFLKHLSYAFIGVLLSFFCFKLGYKKFIQLSPILLAIFSLFLILVFIPGIGREVNGSHRWISLGGISFQPSEFVKYILPAYALCYLLALPSFSAPLFFRLIAILAIPIFLILIEPNNGTAMVIGISLLALFFLMGIPFKYWAVPVLFALFFVSVFAFQLPYVKGRLHAYLHPEEDLKGKGHQPYQAKIATGSGQLWGKGPGNGLQKLSYLPEAQNDYIAAIYAEEFGFLGIFLLIFLYALFGVQGFSASLACQDLSGFLYGSLITFLIIFQAFLNLGVVSGILPSTGLNLPLFSQGGTSLIANFVGIGLLLSISKNN